MDTLILKVILVPILIGAVSVAGRRWGPAVGGWLAGLPWTSGPVALFLALEQGTAFAAQAAQGTLLGLASVAAFCLAYSWMSRRMGWAVSILSGWCAFLAMTYALSHVSVPVLPTFVGVIGVLLGSSLGLRSRGVSAARPTPPAWEIPLRMVAATAMVLAITGGASLLGPRLSGLLTPFPVYATVLAVFTQHFQGSHAATRLLRGVVLGSPAFAVFFLVVTIGLERWGLPATFGLALAVALAVHWSAFRLLGLSEASGAHQGRP